MELSVFPRGLYQAKQAFVRFNSFNKAPFAFCITVKSQNAKNYYATIWDLNAFRPDPREIGIDFSKNQNAVVLYESVNYTQSGRCYKIPRYIKIQQPGKTDKWFVNVR